MIGARPRIYVRMIIRIIHWVGRHKYHFHAENHK
jgi:hypothetical protein